jgi:NAD(P)-dependent dehydrogenase (short-subunit alcohol dehydrogenase family)
VSDVLNQQILVVVGGTTGLGLSAAKAFVQAGARVVVVGRNAESASAAHTELGDNALTYTGDAGDPTTAKAAIELGLSTWGGFHGLYHVAGGSGRQLGDGPVHEITDAGWSGTLRLNLDSLFYSNRAALQQFLKQKSGGTILNMGSVLGFAPSPHHFSTHAYATAKAAIIGFTKSAAAYYAPHNIRLNVIAPALVATPMSRRAQEDEAILHFVQTKQPLDGGRIGRVDDLDGAALYFMSSESRFVTGQVLAVDGGWSVCEGQYE